MHEWNTNLKRTKKHQKCIARRCQWTTWTHNKEVPTSNKSAQQGGAKRT
jgi:hypothetical protein